MVFIWKRRTQFGFKEWILKSWLWLFYMWYLFLQQSQLELYFCIKIGFSPILFINFPWITRIKGICYSHATPNHQSLPLTSRPLVPSRGVLLILMPSPQCMIRFKDLITPSVYKYFNSISLIQNPKVWKALPSTGLEEERNIYSAGKPFPIQIIQFQLKKKWNTSLCIYTSTT